MGRGLGVITHEHTIKVHEQTCNLHVSTAFTRDYGTAIGHETAESLCKITHKHVHRVSMPMCAQCSLSPGNFGTVDTEVIGRELNLDACLKVPLTEWSRV